MAPMAVPSNGIPLGVPMSNHEYDMTDADSFNKGPVRVGANPPPAWSQYVGPVHKAPPSVATQLVVPTNLSDGPVDLTCYHCQHHVRTNTKSGPSFLAWALCCCMCVIGVCIPCALIPFCMRKFKVTEHYCSREDCGILLGKYKGWKGKAAPWSLLFHCFIPSSSSSTHCTKHNKILEVFIIKFEIYLLCMKVLFNIYDVQWSYIQDKTFQIELRWK